MAAVLFDIDRFANVPQLDSQKFRLDRLLVRGAWRIRFFEVAILALHDQSPEITARRFITALLLLIGWLLGYATGLCLIPHVLDYWAQFSGALILVLAAAITWLDSRWTAADQANH